MVAALAAVPFTWAIAEPAGLAGARAASPAIVCPLAMSPGPIQPCCGPPIATTAVASHPAQSPPAVPCCAAAMQPGGTFCCPPNALCAEPFTISAAPPASVAGDPVTIGGSLIGPAAGTQVTLWLRRADKQAFVAAGTTTTDSAGAYRFVLRPKTDDSVYAVAGSRRTATLRLHVRARVTLGSASLSPRGSTLAVTLRGRVTPSHVGEQVLIEQRDDHGHWLSLSLARLGRRSRFRAVIRFPGTGTWTLRAALAADDRNDASASPPVTVGATP